MPRRVLKVEVQNPEELEQEGMEGFPGDGEEYNDEPEVEAAEGEDEGNEPVVKEPDWKSQFEAMQAELNSTRAELQQVRATIPPPQRQQEAAPVEPDWNDEFYKDVPAAVSKIEDRLSKKIEANLTAKYQQDLATRTFWSRFYAAHPDLEDADDLVRSTLSANMSQLGQLSIPKAIEGLAGLTRTRISGYVEKAMKTRGKKATVEGAGSTLPNSRQPLQTTERPYSLSATIKSRRAKRAAAS